MGIKPAKLSFLIFLREPCPIPNHQIGIFKTLYQLTFQQYSSDDFRSKAQGTVYTNDSEKLSQYWLLLIANRLSFFFKQCTFNIMFFDFERVIALVPSFSVQRQKILVFKFKYLEQYCSITSCRWLFKVRLIIKKIKFNSSVVLAKFQVLGCSMCQFSRTLPINIVYITLIIPHILCRA